jgi:predicted aspartyl protease
MWQKFFSLFTRNAVSPYGEQLAARIEYQVAHSVLFSEIRRPVVRAQIWSDKDQDWYNLEMLVDTGADYTILPSYVASLAGIDLNKLEKVRTQGIGGQQHVYLARQVRFRIGTVERVAPVGFLPQAKAPALLGRHLFLETFRTELIKGEALALWS